MRHDSPRRPEKPDPKPEPQAPEQRVTITHNVNWDKAMPLVDRIVSEFSGLKQVSALTAKLKKAREELAAVVKAH